MVYVDVKQHLKKLRRCVKVELAVLDPSPSQISLIVSVDVKHHERRKKREKKKRKKKKKKKANKLDGWKGCEAAKPGQERG